MAQANATTATATAPSTSKRQLRTHHILLSLLLSFQAVCAQNGTENPLTTQPGDTPSDQTALLGVLSTEGSRNAHVGSKTETPEPIPKHPEVTWSSFDTRHSSADRRTRVGEHGGATTHDGATSTTQVEQSQLTGLRDSRRGASLAETGRDIAWPGVDEDDKINSLLALQSKPVSTPGVHSNVIPQLPQPLRRERFEPRAASHGATGAARDVPTNTAAPTGSQASTNELTRPSAADKAVTGTGRAGLTIADETHASTDTAETDDGDVTASRNHAVQFSTERSQKGSGILTVLTHGPLFRDTTQRRHDAATLAKGPPSVSAGSNPASSVTFSQHGLPSSTFKTTRGRAKTHKSVSSTHILQTLSPQKTTQESTSPREKRSTSNVDGPDSVSTSWDRRRTGQLWEGGIPISPGYSSTTEIGGAHRKLTAKVRRSTGDPKDDSTLASSKSGSSGSGTPAESRTSVPESHTADPGKLTSLQKRHLPHGLKHHTHAKDDRPEDEETTVTDQAPDETTAWPTDTVLAVSLSGDGEALVVTWTFQAGRSSSVPYATTNGVDKSSDKTARTKVTVSNIIQTDANGGANTTSPSIAKTDAAAAELLVDGFEVSYRIPGEEEYDSSRLGAKVRTFVLHQLHPDEEYVICVHAMSGSRRVREACANWSRSSLKVVVGILAGTLFLVPCIIVMIAILHKDRKVRAKNYTGDVAHQALVRAFSSCEESHEVLMQEIRLEGAELDATSGRIRTKNGVAVVVGGGGGGAGEGRYIHHSQSRYHSDGNSAGPSQQQPRHHGCDDNHHQQQHKPCLSQEAASDCESSSCQENNSDSGIHDTGRSSLGVKTDGPTSSRYHHQHPSRIPSTSEETELGLLCDIQENNSFSGVNDPKTSHLTDHHADDLIISSLAKSEDEIRNCDAHIRM